MSATVKVAGTSNGVVTDMDGNFTISVPKGAKLQISSIGYTTQTVSVGNGGELDIVLQDDNKLLDEVVAIGYGKAKKGDLSAAEAPWATWTSCRSVPWAASRRCCKDRYRACR